MDTKLLELMGGDLNKDPQTNSATIKHGSTSMSGTDVRVLKIKY